MESEELDFMVSKINHTILRRKTERLVTTLGGSINSKLPLLETQEITRSKEQIASRALILLACSAVSYGFSQKLASSWVEENDLLIHATREERMVLDGGVCDPVYKLRPEAIWALAWVLNVAEDFEFNVPVPANLVHRLPNLKTAEPAKKWIDSTRVIESSDVIAALDFYYCRHWAIQDAALRGVRPIGALPSYAVVERRRALEWCVGKDDWDMISLDT
jgi:hypothetical protein